MRSIHDANALYDGFRRAEKGSDWKPDVQKYEMTYLLGISRVQTELKDGTFEFKPSSEFTVNERGHKRVIHGETIEDRTVKHSLCDEVLNPYTNKYLIFDNGASQVGKGISFSRNRLEYHLHKYYCQHGSNEGYILIIDFTKYYDNIVHSILMNQFKKYIPDEEALNLLEKILKKERIDVSYMTNEEFRNCMNDVFNSMDYYKNHSNDRKGKKFMDKHLDIGDQSSQTSGILYPTPFDNFIKIVKGEKYYGRYMDDSYIIHESKQHLKNLLMELIECAKKLGITINLKKTRICKLSDKWRFLQIQYSLTETGRLIRKINPKRITAMRRKMKKVAFIMSPKDFREWYDSWFNNYRKYMSLQQRQHMDALYINLKIRRSMICTQ